MAAARRRRRCARRSPRGGRRRCCGQGFVYSLHSGLVLSREDTRNLTRDWLVDTVPERGRIVVEPVVPDAWAQDIGHPSPLTTNGNRWVKFPTSRSNVANDGSLIPGDGRVVNIEDFERTLFPELVDRYEERRLLLGRRRLDPARPRRGRARGGAAARSPTTRELERRADLAYEARPYREGKGPVPFNFDWTFDYYPLAYDRPGPVMTVYRLQGGRVRGSILMRPMMRTETDHEHLARAIELADRGRGRVQPQPVVGAVVVRDGRVLGEGWHEEYGGPHAEVNAIAACGDADLARRDALRLAGALLPPRQDAAVHRRDPRRGHRPRRRRLRRPDREGLRPRAGHPARRGRRGRRRRRRARRARAARSTRPSASTRAPAARGCCSSRR